jgi:hypothetical protein
MNNNIAGFLLIQILLLLCFVVYFFSSTSYSKEKTFVNYDKIEKSNLIVDNVTNSISQEAEKQQLIIIKDSISWSHQLQYAHKYDSCIWMKNPLKFDFEVTDSPVVGVEKIFMVNIESESYNGRGYCNAYCKSIISIGFHPINDVILSYTSEIANKFDSTRVFRTPLQQKKKKILIMISNCRENRLNYVRKYIPSDLYDYVGRCNLPNKVDYGTRWGVNVESDFKFIGEYRYYLSLENVLCKGYVSEKFYKVLYARTIPLLYSRKFLPYHMLNFTSSLTFLDGLKKKINFID